MGDNKPFKIAGMTIKNEVSLGNFITALAMIASVIAFGISMQKDIEANTKAINSGVLPEADKRITTLETLVSIELANIRREMVGIRREIQTQKP